MKCRCVLRKKFGRRKCSHCFISKIEKEIQQSEMIFNTASAAEPEAPPLLPPVVKAAPAPFKPHAPLNSKRKACALFPPDDPNAFVLYRPDVLDRYPIISCKLLMLEIAIALLLC